MCYLTRKKMAYKHDQNFSLTQKCHLKWYFALFLKQSTHLIVFLKKYLLTEADTYCLIKAVFLKILQNSLENTCATVFFNKVAACNFIKKKTWAQTFSSEFCGIFENPCSMLISNIFVYSINKTLTKLHKMKVDVALTRKRNATD